MSRFPLSLQLACALVALVALVGAAPYPERGAGIVASDHPLSSEAGAAMLSAGGNAVDAAIAAALSAGVVQPAGSGLGGGGFAVITLPGGGRHVVDFREVAPGASTRDMYRTDDGERIASLTGHQGSIYAVAVHPDGTRVAAGGFDGAVRLYDVKEQKLIKAFVPVEVETNKVAGKP